MMWMLLVIFSRFWLGQASAADQYAQCAQLKDARERLACFDRASGSSGNADRRSKQKGPAYEEVSLAELEADLQHFAGRHVTTTGRFTMKGEVGMLQTAAMDGSPVTILVTKVGHATQDALMSNCSYIAPDEGCSVRVSGTVVSGPAGVAIGAERISFD